MKSAKAVVIREYVSQGCFKDQIRQHIQSVSKCRQAVNEQGHREWQLCRKKSNSEQLGKT